MFLTTTFILGGCSSEPSQLSTEDIEGLSLEEQTTAIVENAKLFEDFDLVVKDNSIAVIYPTEYIPDSTLVLDDSKESFPNVAMTLVEHLSVLDANEIVITSYEPGELDDLTRVSALFNKDTINDLDFEDWKENKEKFPQRVYRYSDSYLIRGNIWEKLDEEIQGEIGNHSKNEINSESDFWNYYGRIVE